MAEPLVVVGGSIAALVTADAAARRGREVQLLLPAGRVGSGFLPLRRGERRLDLGPRIIELGYDGPPEEPPPLERYVPGPHGHRPYLRLIDDLVRGLAGDDLEPITHPQITRGGTRGLDFLLGGDLVDLPRLLRDDERAAVAVEAAEIASRLGPEGLLADQDGLSELSLAEASVATQGATFHTAVLAPLTDKILPGGASSVIASLRRKIWMPLFWPQSLAAACTGTLEYRPHRPMHTIAGGGMGAVVERLLARLHAEPAVDVRSVGAVRQITRSAGGISVELDEGSSIVATDVVLAVGAEESFRLAGWSGAAAVRVRGVYVWLDVPTDQLLDPASVLFVLDPDVPAYRLSENTSDQRPGHTTMVCELAGSVSDDDAPAVAARVLEQAGVAQPGAEVEVVDVLAGPAFAAPSVANRARHDEALTALRQADLPVDVVGVGAFGADTFNEQVVQGLAAAERWS